MNKITNWDDFKEDTYIDKEGNYTLKIMSYTEGSSANGKEFHKYNCETIDGEKISLTLYLIENAMWKYKAFVNACGLEAKGAVNLVELPKTLVGRKFVGEVKRQPAKMNVATGLVEESKYFEVAKFHKVEG